MMLDPHTQQGANRDKPTGSGDDWMITFADLLALMLTFFVLLFSMSTVKVSQWQSLVESLAQQFNPYRVSVDIETDRIDRSIGRVETEGLPIAYLERLISQSIAEEPLLDDAMIGRSATEVIVALPIDLIFDDRSLRMKQVGRTRLGILANKLALISNKIRIAVHAAPASQRGITGQDLAREYTLAQARQVAEVLSDNGYRRPIASIGYGTSRFDKLDVDLPQYERQSLADRVDIMIIRDGRDTTGTIF